MSDQLDELSILIRSRIPLVQVETLEETRIIRFLEGASAREGWDFFTWTAADGLRKFPQTDALSGTDAFRDALHCINDTLASGVFAMFDVQPHLQDSVSQRLVKEIALGYGAKPRTLIFVGASVELPTDLARLSARFSPQLPNLERIREIYLEEAYRWLSEKQGRKLINPPDTEDLLLQHLAGMPEEDVHRLSLNAIRHGRISLEEVRRVLEFKRQTLGKSGLIEFYADSSSLEDVGGLDGLKSWLELRRTAFVGDEKKQHVDPPKGMLLLGVQGAGKSLAAKAVAGSWHVPLIRLDFGALYNKFLGESERNLREALKQAEAMAPCVLWIDEIEKALASDGSGAGDGGVSRRLLATVLTWMAERTAKVFLVATANDVTQLPPELLRKGRLDEIFFLDLPNAASRRDILRIHLKKRKLDPAQFDVAQLAASCAGFSGAEIEQALVAAIYAANAGNEPPNTAHLLCEFHRTRPLSVVMAEKITALRLWASGRTVSAG